MLAAVPAPTSVAIAVFTFAVRAASLANSPAPRLLESESVAQAERPKKAAANNVANDLLTRTMLASVGNTRRKQGCTLRAPGMQRNTSAETVRRMRGSPVKGMHPCGDRTNPLRETMPPQRKPLSDQMMW
jgi:hypothetical protein